ncbi:hypothetical protein Taro_005782, partial [Colocasia esculenta]|nr:hypothetical protein [Colocasia esculenta]
MASRGRRGGAPAREDEPRRDERAEQQAPAPQGPVFPPPPPVDYGVIMQGLVQAMQTQAHTQVALQAQLEAQGKVLGKVSVYFFLSQRATNLQKNSQPPDDQEVPTRVKEDSTRTRLLLLGRLRSRKNQNPQSSSSVAEGDTLLAVFFR